MRYGLFEVGGDAEWDELPYSVIAPSQRAAASIEEVLGEFDPAEGQALASMTVDAVSAIQPLAARLGMGPPIVFFADLRGDSMVARFIDGTECHNPVFAIDPRPHMEVSLRMREVAISDSLIHELGHAWLRSIGVEYVEAEEDVVEHFARTGDIQVLLDWAEAMD